MIGSADTSVRSDLVLRGFGVAFGDQVVLAEVDLHVPAPGLTVLMGPMRGGKSALLRTLAGLNDAQPCLRTWGDATFGGRPLTAGNRPVLVVQHAALLASTVHENLVSGLPDRARLTPGEQRRAITAALDARGLSELGRWLDDRASTLPKVTQRLVAIVRAVLAEPTMLCVDEPTAGMNDEDAIRVLDLLALERERRGGSSSSRTTKRTRAGSAARARCSRVGASRPTSTPRRSSPRLRTS